MITTKENEQVVFIQAPHETIEDLKRVLSQIRNIDRSITFVVLPLEVSMFSRDEVIQLLNNFKDKNTIEDGPTRAHQAFIDNMNM
jgi:hypothetical protein